MRGSPVKWARCASLLTDQAAPLAAVAPEDDPLLRTSSYSWEHTKIRRLPLGEDQNHQLRGARIRGMVWVVWPQATLAISGLLIGAGDRPSACRWAW